MVKKNHISASSSSPPPPRVYKLIRREAKNIGQGRLHNNTDYTNKEKERERDLWRMVAEALPNSHEAPPVVLGLQPAALIDNVAPVDWSLLDQIPGDRGGSIPVSNLDSKLCFFIISADFEGTLCFCRCKRMS